MKLWKKSRGPLGVLAFVILTLILFVLMIKLTNDMVDFIGKYSHIVEPVATFLWNNSLVGIVIVVGLLWLLFWAMNNMDMEEDDDN